MINYVNFALKCDNEYHMEDPANINELMLRTDIKMWKTATEEEISSLNENHTWNLVELTKGRKAIKTKWIFKTKRGTDGNVIRHKARLVAKGYSQQYGIDYDSTYAPVVRNESNRFLIALAFVTAFLQGKLDEEIYIMQPELFDDGTKRVCKLNRAMYGLKQARRQWNLKLDATLKSFGLKSCSMDPCIYYNEDLKLIIAIYVDDFLIFYKDKKKLELLKNHSVYISK